MSTLSLSARANVVGTPRRTWRPLTLAALATLYLVWGSTYLAMRIAVSSFPPLMLGALRFTTAGTMLLALLVFRGAKLPTVREWIASAVIGCLMMVVGLGTVALAYEGNHVTSGVAALMFGTVPLWTAIFERAFGRKLVTRQAVGLTLGFLGVLLVATRGTLRSSPGWSLALAACAASYAFGCALNVRVPLPKGSVATAAQMIVAGVVLGAGSLLRGETFPAEISVKAWLSLAHLVVLGSMVAYSALTFLLRTESPALATSYAFVNPIVALGLGAWLGGERVTPGDFTGVTLVIAAVVAVASARSGEKSTTPFLSAARRQALR
ncbi:MAG: drug/metabolite exporter YedA [Polyangiaceae bacterium]